MRRRARRSRGGEWSKAPVDGARLVRRHCGSGVVYRASRLRLRLRMQVQVQTVDRGAAGASHCLRPSRAERRCLRHFGARRSAEKATERRSAARMRFSPSRWRDRRTRNVRAATIASRATQTTGGARHILHIIAASCRQDRRDAHAPIRCRTVRRGFDHRRLLRGLPRAARSECAPCVARGRGFVRGRRHASRSAKGARAAGDAIRKRIVAPHRFSQRKNEAIRFRCVIDRAIDAIRVHASLPSSRRGPVGAGTPHVCRHAMNMRRTCDEHATLSASCARNVFPF